LEVGERRPGTEAHLLKEKQINLSGRTKKCTFGGDIGMQVDSPGKKKVKRRTPLTARLGQC
jgi:hypothetical protein